MAEFKLDIPEVNFTEVGMDTLGTTAQSTAPTRSAPEAPNMTPLPANFNQNLFPEGSITELNFDISPTATSDQLESDVSFTLPGETTIERFDTSAFVAPDTTPTPEAPAPVDTEQTDLEKEREGLKGDLEKGFESLSDLGRFQMTAEEEAGLQAKREAVTAINNQIMRKERELDLAIRDIKDTTLTRAQKSARINEITDKANRRLADLAIRQMAVQGQFNDAQALVQRKVDLETQARKANLDKLMFFYGENKDRLSTVEQRAFEQRIQAEERAYVDEREQKLMFEDFKYSILANAVSMGAGMAVYDQIQATDSMDDLLRMRNLSTYFNGPQAATGGFSAPTVKNINGVDMQWDATTGQWVELPGVGVSDYSIERAARTRSSVSSLLADAIAAPEIFGRSAAVPLPDFMRSDEFRNFKSELDTLKSNIAFNELTAMREASKTGGALGQVSDREGRLLQSALGALSMSQSPANLQAELKKIDASIARWQAAVQEQGGVVNSNIIMTAPDGTQVEIID